jgi:hypothetical protein
MPPNGKKDRLQGEPRRDREKVETAGPKIAARHGNGRPNDGSQKAERCSDQNIAIHRRRYCRRKRNDSQ